VEKSKFKKVDVFVKTHNFPYLVIPAEAGVSLFHMFWIPASAGMTEQGAFYEFSEVA